MKNWRPENWEHDKFHECMRITGGGGDYANIYEVFEAGADAMLRELKIVQELDKHPIFIKNCRSNQKRHCKCCSDCPFRGWLIPIPDEEIKCQRQK